MIKRVHIFVGEFSYALNWHGPWLNQIINDSSYHDTVVTLPAYASIYRKYADDIDVLPYDVWSRLGKLATIGEHNNGQDITPTFIIDYCKEKYNDCEIFLPPRIDPFHQNPPGIFEHFEPELAYKNDIAEIFSNFKKEKTIMLMAKHREEGGSKGQNWNHDEWSNMIIDLLENYNIILLEIIDENKSHGGTYKFDIEHENLITYTIDRDDEYALDKQAWILKLSDCSIYGSTGAANLPFWCNTPVCAIMLTKNGHRLNFNWQKKLTDDHKNNLILLIDDFNVLKYHDIKSYIASYIQENKEKYETNVN